MAIDKLAIDFGSAYTKIYKYGAGLVLSEPTVVTVSTDGHNKMLSAGNEAKKQIGKTTENSKVVFPVFEGEVVNVKMAVELLKYFLNKIEFKGGLFGADAIFSVPCGATLNTLQKLSDVASQCGIKDVSFVEAPLLALFGLQIPLAEYTPYFVVDMGAGVTNIAALSTDGVVGGISMNYGGNHVDTNLIDYIVSQYNLQVGVLTAENLKVSIGALDQNDELGKLVNGRFVSSSGKDDRYSHGVPRSVNVKANKISKPIFDYYDKIAEMVVQVLAKLPPEVAAEIRYTGINLVGGMASVYGLEQYFSKKLGMKVVTYKHPQLCSALGGGELLSKPEIVKKIKIKAE